nr:hypothetical protein HK105_007949 [Polyrhizophydium stewartii]
MPCPFGSDLSNNRISDGLSVVKILNTGCALNLASNKLSAPISDICGGKKVKWNGLDISFNNISGDVSQCFQRQSMTFL